jgi:hypothetical protein
MPWCRPHSTGILAEGQATIDALASLPDRVAAVKTSGPMARDIAALLKKL